MTDATTAQVATALRIARMIVTSIGVAADSEAPLSDNQKIAMITAALIEFDGFRDELGTLLALDRLIADSAGHEDHVRRRPQG
jgi:hypothetical protein